MTSLKTQNNILNNILSHRIGNDWSFVNLGIGISALELELKLELELELIQQTPLFPVP